MQGKSSKKGSSCQALGPETPEQKQIRLLKKALAKTKLQATEYRTWWIEQSDKAEQLQKRMDEYRNLCHSFSDRNESLLDSLAMAHKTARDWQQLYEQGSPRGAGRGSGSARIGRDDKDPDQWAAGDLLEEFNIIQEADPSSPAFSPKDGNVNLICIKPGVLDIKYPDGSIYTHPEDQLDHLSRYTSPGLITNEDGLEVYPINELGGRPMWAGRFYVSQVKRKRGRPKKSK